MEVRQENINGAATQHMLVKRPWRQLRFRFGHFWWSCGNADAGHWAPLPAWHFQCSSVTIAVKCTAVELGVLERKTDGQMALSTLTDHIALPRIALHITG